MAEPIVWGLLPKAQDDPTTIDEAISAAIAAHEADPEAHLGDGESLQSHRQNAVVDHPQGSILGDKFTNQDFVFTPSFESFDNWDKAGATVQAQPGGLKLGTANTTNAVAYLYAGADYVPVAYGPSISTTMQAVLALSSTSDILAYFLAGSNQLVNETPGVGFKFENGNVYGVEAYHSGGSYHENTVSLGTYAANAFHLYRVQVVPADGKAYFYVDGALVDSLTLHSDDAGGLALMSYYIKTSANAFKFIFSGAPYLSLVATP